MICILIGALTVQAVKIAKMESHAEKWANRFVQVRDQKLKLQQEHNELKRKVARFSVEESDPNFLAMILEAKRDREREREQDD